MIWLTVPVAASGRRSPVHEGDLLAGTEALAKARQNLAKVQEVLEAVGILVSIAAKVAKFVVVP